MSVMCEGCVFFNEDKKSDEKHGHYCSKHDDYVLANEYTCDDYKPKLSPLLKAALFPAFLSSVSDYMGEIEDGGADNG